MKASRPLEPEDTISGVVEAVSFDNTLGEIERVVEEGLGEDRVRLVNSVEMYEVIANFEMQESGRHRSQVCHKPVRLGVIFEESPQFSSILHIHSFEEVQGLVLLKIAWSVAGRRLNIWSNSSYTLEALIFLFFFSIHFIKTCRVILNNSSIANATNIAFSNSDHVVFPS